MTWYCLRPIKSSWLNTIANCTQIRFAIWPSVNQAKKDKKNDQNTSNK